MILIATASADTHTGESDREKVYLGPWCMGTLSEWSGRAGSAKMAPSPWKPATGIRTAADYCRKVYERTLPKMSAAMNAMHGTDHPEIYWRTLTGFWLSQFIEIFYDRYSRIKAAIEAYPLCSVNVLDPEKCYITSYSVHQLLNEQVGNDIYNLKLFSIIADSICHDNVRVIEAVRPDIAGGRSRRSTLKGRVMSRILDLADDLFRTPIILADMYQLTAVEAARLKAGNLAAIGFKHFVNIDEDRYDMKRDGNMRSVLGFDEGDDFERIIGKAIPQAMPYCYVEDYSAIRSSVRCRSWTKTVGSAVGWHFNERFKFYAAEAASNGARLVEFQHGGGYGTLLSQPIEEAALEKDRFYTWGWTSGSDKVRRLPSPYFSKMKDSHCPTTDDLLFVGISVARYQYRFNTWLFPDDMLEYAYDKEEFLKSLIVPASRKVLYRPYFNDYGWGEKGFLKERCPALRYAEDGKLTDLMRSARMVVIDHPHTSFMEAMVMNVPSVFYWDPEVYLMREDSLKYFKALEDAGIYHRTPDKAAAKVNQVFGDPQRWWNSNSVQDARKAFCERFAYSSKDWLREWQKELDAFN